MVLSKFTSRKSEPRKKYYSEMNLASLKLHENQYTIPDLVCRELFIRSISVYIIY